MTALLTEAPTARLWATSVDVYEQILAHPFLEGLATGRLERAAFHSYVVQDSHYLRDYARALAVLGGRAPTAGATSMFTTHAAEAVAVEQALHEGLLAELATAGGTGPALPPSPTTVAYTSHLLAVVHGGSFAEGVAAVLPCYWVYQRVGQTLVERGSPDPLYGRWIQTYGGEEFAAVVRSVLALTDELAADTSTAEWDRMERAFHTSARYEWMFWDAAWRQERWPV